MSKSNSHNIINIQCSNNYVFQNLSNTTINFSAIAGSVNEKEIESNESLKQEAKELIDIIKTKLVSSEIENKESMLKEVEQNVSLGAKLKLMLPIIPKILEFEGEIGWERSAEVHSWRDLLKLFKKKRQ